MRRKKIPVPEFIRILERLSSLIKNELKTNLSQTMLKEYIKNDFLLRKVKLKQKEKSMDHRDLQKVYDNSIVEIFAEIVKNHLCPEVKKVDPLHAMVDPPDPEVMELKHVFQEFRIVIL
jgi:SPX domain protein involved in polyphosphate accumulation